MNATRDTASAAEILCRGGASPLRRAGKGAVHRLVLAGFALCAFLGAAHAGERTGEVVFDDFESQADRWTPSTGERRAVPDPARKLAGKVLEWRYAVPKDYAFLNTGSKVERFAGADEIAFLVRSNRPGKLYIRVDQTDGANFARDFEVGTEWREVRFRLKDIPRASFGFSKLDGSKVKTVYIVDLSGKDDGMTGNRVVWLDNVRAIGPGIAADAARPAAPSGKAVERVDDDADSVKEGLVLRAYDADGGPVTLEKLKSYGVSGASYAFLTDLAGYPRPGVLVSAGWTDRNLPVLKPQKDEAVVINVLFWPIPNFGKMWVTADNAGEGYRLTASSPARILNLNLELARSRLAMVERHYEGARRRVPALGALAQRLDKLRAMVRRAEAGTTEQERARLADVAMAEGMALGETLALEIARADIQANRTGGLVVEVKSSSGAPVPGAQVEISQVRNDFLFGVVQSLGFTEHKTPPETYERDAKLARDAGFNNLTVTLFWNHIEPKENQYIADDWDRRLGLRYFYDLGFSFKEHGLLHAWLPDWVKDDGKRKFADNVTRNFAEMVPRYNKLYPGAFSIWQASNEAGSNRFLDLSIDEKVNLLKRISATIRKAAPGARVWINEVDWDRAQRFWPSADQHLKDLMTPLEFFELLNRENVSFDIAGIQWYPGLRVSFMKVLDLSEPMVDLLRTMEQLDRYQKLRQPLHITEFAIPGTSERGWRNGYRYANWDRESQARFATEFYTIAFSRPHVHEVTYWGLTDNEPWAVKGGLLDDNNDPKPIYRSLKALLGGWRSSGSGRTDGKGQMQFQGFAGDYRVTVRVGGSLTQASARISERQRTVMTVQTGK